MKLSFYSAAALAVVSTSAFAADLPARSAMPVKAPIVAAAYSWTGFQIGVQGGWGTGKTTWQNTAVNNLTASNRIEGGFFGVRGGYDYQIGQAVLGVSAEYNWADIKGQALPITPGFADRTDYKLKNFGSVDARLGIAFDRVLAYAIGGFAWSTLDHTYTSPGVGVATWNNQGFTGWDIGAGVDVAVTSNVIARVEYRHYDFGKASYSPPVFAPGVTHTVRMTTDTIRGGLAYKF